MRPSSPADSAWNTLDATCATAVTLSVWPSSTRSNAPVSHAKSFTAVPEQHSRYLESLVNSTGRSTSDPPACIAGPGRRSLERVAYVAASCDVLF
eukprot:scaffold29170_cov84-Isochrysis_galbana.AAC.2